MINKNGRAERVLQCSYKQEMNTISTAFIESTISLVYDMLESITSDIYASSISLKRNPLPILSAIAERSRTSLEISSILAISSDIVEGGDQPC